MKPINEREVTVSLIQFCVLFIITVCLAVFYVWGDVLIKSKDCSEWKRKAQDIQNKEVYFAKFTALVDTINTNLNSLDKLDEASFDTKKFNTNNLIAKLEGDDQDAEYTSNLKAAIMRTSEGWLTDKIKLRHIPKLEDEIAKLNRNNKTLRDFITQKGFKPEELDMTLEK